MKAIREIVSRDIFVNFDIPKEFGNKFEMILVPIEKIVDNEIFLAANCNLAVKEDAREDQILMKYQAENGFSQNILSQESEDIWNDI